MTIRRKRPIPASRGVKSMVPGVRGFDAAADQVAAELERREMSVRALAEQSGVTRESLAYWINGKRPLRADYLMAVVRTLSITLK